MTKYTAIDGTSQLKAAIQRKFERDNSLHYEPNQILVSCGAKHTLFNACMAVLSPDDEAVIPAPSWVSYPDMVRVADGIPVMIETGIESDFKITPDQLESSITARTRVLFLNSPSNPTGSCYTRAELEALGAVLREHKNIVVLADDIYEHIHWAADPFCSLATACPDLIDQVVTINGVSKCYAMTGWRIGYAGGPPEVIKAMKTIQSQITSNPSSISQAAAVAALDGDQSCVTEMKNAYQARSEYIVEALNTIPGALPMTPRWWNCWSARRTSLLSLVAPLGHRATSGYHLPAQWRIWRRQFNELELFCDKLRCVGIGRLTWFSA